MVDSLKGDDVGEDDVFNSLEWLWAELAGLQETSKQADTFAGLNDAAFELEQRLIARQLQSIHGLMDYARAFTHETAQSRQMTCSFLTTLKSGPSEQIWLASSELDILKQIVVHAIRNSFAHGFAKMDELQAPPYVELSFSVQGGQIEMVLTDNGTGASSAPKEAFGSNPSVGLVDLQSGRGVGMGAIRSLVARLDGSLEIQGRSGGGFSLCLRFWPRLLGVRAVRVEPARSPSGELPPLFFVSEASVQWRDWEGSTPTGGSISPGESSIVDSKRNLGIMDTSTGTSTTLEVLKLAPPVLVYFRQVSKSLAFESGRAIEKDGPAEGWFGRMITFDQPDPGALARPFYLLGWKECF